MKNQIEQRQAGNDLTYFGLGRSETNKILNEFEETHNELERLQAIEKAIQEYTGPDTYQGVIDWLESVTDYKNLRDGMK